MQKTIIEHDPESFDNHVNSFAKFNKIIQIQTHVLRSEGMKDDFIAVIDYKTKAESVLSKEEEAILARLEKNQAEVEEEVF